MSKTAETILAEITEQDVKDFSPSIIRKDKAFYIREDSTIQAMQKYADQEKEAEAVNFHMWCSFGATETDRHLFLDLYRQYRKQQTGGK